MTKKELKFVKNVHDGILGGTYVPQKLSEAVLIIGNEMDITFMNVEQKRRILAGFMQYQYPNLIKEEVEPDLSDPMCKPIEDEPEEVKMEKPTTTKKKRVYKRKK